MAEMAINLRDYKKREIHIVYSLLRHNGDNILFGENLDIYLDG